MHIPDGYMAPQTTVPAIAAMVPMWGIAAKKVKDKIGDKNLPTLALGAAFSFTIMMINVPAVGGTSAHAVGAVLIAILLGPWSAVVAVSCALLIQALVFGDGGVLALGVNCLNMAVVMPFTGYAVYRLIEGKNKIGGSRSLIGAFAGSYVGLNAAALFAAIEFGIQPMLFKAADGTALYCPYDLSVSIPAMMVPHMLVAGILEGLITVAAVSYIAKAAPYIFVRHGEALSSEGSERRPFFKKYKAMLIILIVTIVLTPLGLLTEAAAWGEWGADEIKTLVGYVPRGFEAAADLWKSIMPDYTLSGSDGTAAYLISAAVGIALIAVLISLMYLLMKKSKKGRTGAEDR